MARTHRAKRRLVILISLVAIVGVVALLGYGGLRWYRARQANEALVEGLAKFDAGDYEGALGKLSAYVSRNQHDAHAITKLARCREEVPEVNSRHLISAANFYKAALRLAPGDGEALSGLVSVYRRLGFATELEDAASSLLEIDPKNVAALEALVVLADSRGLWDVAQERARQLVSVAPDDYRWRILTLHVMRRGGVAPEPRAAQVQNWIGEGETDGRYRLMLAEIAATAGRADEARQQAVRAAELGMPDTALLSALIDILDVLGEQRAANVALERAAKAGLDPIGMALMQVRRHWLAGRLADAELALAAVPEIESTDDRRFQLLRWRVILAETAGENEAADRALAELLEAAERGDGSGRHATWATALQATRVAEQRSGSVSSAKSALVEALTSNRHDPYLLLRTGDIAALLGEPDEALQSYKAAYDGEGRRWLDAGLKTAQESLRTGRTEEGFRLAREIVGRFETSVAGVLMLAEACTALAKEGRVPALVDPTLPRGISGSMLLSGIDAQLPGKSFLLPALAFSYLAEDDLANARATIQRAIEHDNASPELLLSMAAALVDERLSDAPESLVEAAEKRGARPAAIAQTRAAIALLRGNPAGARRTAEAALAAGADALTKKEADALVRLVAESAAINRDSDAGALLSKCIADHPDDVATAGFVLAQEVTWRDESLVAAAISTLERQMGSDSPRVVLADATRTLLFHASKSGRVAQRIIAVNDLLRENPQSPATLIVLGRLLAAAQPPDYAQAAGFIERAISLQPGRRDLYPELVSMLQAAGDYPSAHRYLQQYMRSTVDDTDATRLGANLLLAQGQYGEAIQALQRIVTERGTEVDAIALADAQRRAGQLAAAEATFAKAYQAPERTALATLAYVEFLGRTGRVAEAMAVLEGDAAASTPSLPEVERAVATARLELDYGDPAAARPAIEDAVRLAPDNPSVLLVAARFHKAIGDEGTALATAQRGLVLAPTHADLLAFTSSLLIADSTQSKEADAALNALAAANPGVAELLRVVRSSAASDGSMRPGPEVLRNAEALTDRYPNLPTVWTVAAQLFAAAGRTEDAIRIARRGMLRLPTDPAPAEIAAKLLLSQRRFAEARDAAVAWKSLAAESPFLPDLVLAEIALRDRKPEACIAALKPHVDRMTKPESRDAQGISMYTLALLQLGRPDDAHQVFAKRLATDRDARAEWLRALRIAPTPDALRALELAGSSMTGDEGALARITEYAAVARRADAEGSVETARALMDSLSPAARESRAARTVAADLLCAGGNVESGVAAYQALWDEISPDDQSALLRWASLDEAPKARLGEMHMFAAYVSNNMASALAGAKVDLDRALEAVDRAAVMMPGEATILDTKAQVHLARGEISIAREVAQSARGRPGAGPELDLTLAEIELADGRLGDAQSHLQSAERLIGNDALIDPMLSARLSQLSSRIASAHQSG